MGSVVETPGPERSIRDDVAAVLGGYRSAASATADLAAAELRLAASTTVLLLVLAVAMALLASASWLLLMLALAAYIADAPDWPVALLVVAGLNALGALGCWGWVQAVAPNLTFRELRAALAGRPPGGPGPSRDTA